MDIEASGKQVSQEMAREFLIAISNSEPDELLSSTNVPENMLPSSDNLPTSFASINGLLTNGDVVEKYRSKLLSICDMEAPDASMLQVALKL